MPVTSPRWRRRPTSAPRHRCRSAARRAATAEPDRDRKPPGADDDKRGAGARQRARAQGRQRRGRVPPQPRRAARSQCRLGGSRGARGREPVGERSAQAGRHRPDRGRPARAARGARRPHGAHAVRRGDAAHRRDSHAHRRAGLAHAPAVADHEPERRLPADADRHLRAAARGLQPGLGAARASSARSACCSRCSHSRSCP